MAINAISGARRINKSEAPITSSVRLPVLSLVIDSKVRG
jgi:hypothetical protein